MREREICPDCGELMTRDWEGDPDVINGVNYFWTCEDCQGDPKLAEEAEEEETA